MRIRLLGTAAGGGFPQWNCGCHNCQRVRAGDPRLRPRTQSCLAVSAGSREWFLINASPDVRAQVESFAPLAPSIVRDTPISGVLLTSADLDHTLGLLVLREGEPMVVHATAAVRQTLVEDLKIANCLDHYCGIEWREPPARLSPLGDDAAGLQYSAFAVPGKPPRYSSRSSPKVGDAVGYRISDPATGGQIVCLPGLAAVNEVVVNQIADCDALFLDGTFWSENEMSETGVSTATASDMGHLPIGGPNGSLARIRQTFDGRLVYVHINNTNPMLIKGSAHRKEVEDAGAMVGEDAMEFIV